MNFRSDVILGHFLLHKPLTVVNSRGQSKIIKFGELELRNHSETFAIDRTHEYCIYTKYEGHRSTLTDFPNPKTFKKQDFSLNFIPLPHCFQSYLLRFPKNHQLRYTGKSPIFRKHQIGQKIHKSTCMKL